MPQEHAVSTHAPAFRAVTSTLEALYTVQLAEKTAAGAAYAADVQDGYVCADELGNPVHPERYSDEFHRIAGDLPRIKLHGTRGSVNSYLERLGVPETLRAAWLGHTIAVNRSNYLGKPQTEELAVIGTALSGLLRADVTKV